MLKLILWISDLSSARNGFHLLLDLTSPRALGDVDFNQIYTVWIQAGLKRIRGKNHEEEPWGLQIQIFNHIQLLPGVQPFNLQGPMAQAPLCQWHEMLRCLDRNGQDCADCSQPHGIFPKLIQLADGFSMVFSLVFMLSECKTWRNSLSHLVPIAVASATDQAFQQRQQRQCDAQQQQLQRRRPGGHRMTGTRGSGRK